MVENELTSRDFFASEPSTILPVIIAITIVVIVLAIIILTIRYFSRRGNGDSPYNVFRQTLRTTGHFHEMREPAATPYTERNQ